MLQEHKGVYIPTDDTNIDEVFDRIYARKFKEYLCEILDGVHTYHIFNTYIFIELNGYFSGNFTFFSLLSLKPYLSTPPSSSNYINISVNNAFNKIYANKLNKPQNTNFIDDMQYVIDIFLKIYEFPSHPIIKPTDEYKNIHTNQEIIDLIKSTGIIHKKTHNADSKYDFITKNITTESIIQNLPFEYWPFTIIEKNGTMVKLLECIEEPDKCSNEHKPKPTPEPEPKPRSSRNYRSTSRSKTSKRHPISLSPIEGIAEYIPGFSPTPSPKRSTRRNTSRFDTTRKENTKNPKNTNTKRKRLKKRRRGFYGLY